MQNPGKLDIEYSFLLLSKSPLWLYESSNQIYISEFSITLKVLKSHTNEGRVIYEDIKTMSSHVEPETIILQLSDIFL